MSDITRSKPNSTKSEPLLGGSELAALIEALPHAAALFHRDGTLRAANTQARALWMVDDQAPLASQSWHRVLSPLGATAVSLLEATAAEALPHAQTVPCGAAGAQREVRTAAVGAELLLITALDAMPVPEPRDVPQPRAHELEALLDLMPASVRIVDVTGQIVRQNRAAQAEHAPVQPTTLRELWQRDAPQHSASARPQAFLDSPGLQALSGATVTRERLDVQRLGRRRVVESSSAPIYDAAGMLSGAVLLDRDITDAQALIASHEAADRGRRFAAVGQLAAGVMHEVNNVLNPIMSAAYLLRHHAESPDAVRDYAARIQQAVETGAALASRVGRFVRQDPVHAGGDEALDLTVLAAEVLDLTEPTRLTRSGARGIVHVLRALDEPVRTRGLPGEIREALRHLVQNAVDAMPAGGTLTMRAFVDEGDACVAVRDTGVGMSDEVRERAFEPFFTTKGARGTGLGLAEVYGIARRHQGSAIIRSMPGEGTEVTLRFPHDTVPLDESTSVPASATDNAASQHILVVEDDEGGRELLRRILQGAGHTVDAVGTCAEARERIAQPPSGPYTLLLTDVGLPDGDGWDLVRYCREQTPEVRVGVISGWEPVAGSENTSGADFVLEKPLRLVELQDHIARRVASASSNE